MKATLIKGRDYYDLYKIDKDGKKVTFASTQDYKQKLSKQNCDEIFGVVDVEKLAVQFMIDESYGEQSTDLWKGYLFGFNKAMELNKDKVFTLEDMKKAYSQGELEALETGSYSEKENQFIQSLQQPTEIEVEIEMELEIDASKLVGAIYGHKPKLDKSKYLILKRM